MRRSRAVEARAPLKDCEEEQEESGEEPASLSGRRGFGSARRPFLLPEISKCSVPDGPFFPHGVPVRKVAAFQQMVI